MRCLALLFLFALSSAAQTPTITLSAPTTSGAPFLVHAGTYLPVTAIVNGANNKGVLFTSSGGTLLHASCSANGPCTAAIYSATATGSTPISVTATAAANSSVSATMYVKFTASPVVPDAAHTPQFLVNSTTLATLQARATSSNVAFTSMKNLANSYYNKLIATPDLGGIAWVFTCPAGTGAPTAGAIGYPDDQSVYYFAWMKLMGDTSRDWGCFVRAILMHELPMIQSGAIRFSRPYDRNHLLLAQDTPEHLLYLKNFAPKLPEGKTIPFSGNVWSDESQYFVVGMGWAIQSGAITATADLNVIRSFYAWAARNTNSYGYGSVVSTTGFNTSMQFTTGDQWELSSGQRGMGNNYIMSKILWNFGAAFTFHDDATNDPLLTGANNTCGATRYQVCPDFTAGSLHAYWTLTDGSYLLKEWAHLEDPAITYPTLNAFYPSGGFGSPIKLHWAFGGVDTYEAFGDGWGGEAAEGSWYSYSFYRLRLALNILHDAGYDDPLLYGPQAALGDGTFWDLKPIADRLFMTGTYTQSTPTAAAYGFLSTGDTNTSVTQRTPYDFVTETETLTADLHDTGRTDRNNANLWMTMDTAFGGKLGTLNGCTAYCGFNQELNNFYGSNSALDIFLTQSVNDPTTITTSDPAPNYPKDWWNPSNNQHQEVRSGFANSDTIFSVYGSNTLINHEAQTQGRFDIYFNGGIVTRGSFVFTDYLYGFYSTGRQNMVQIYDAPGVGAGSLSTCVAHYTGYYGGQLLQAYQRGMTQAVHSEMPTYAAFGIDASVGQNGCFRSTSYQFSDTTQAYRDVIYLRGSNQAAWYDRDTTNTGGNKVLFLNTSAKGTASSNTVTWTTSGGGNKVKYTSLLPTGATVATETLVDHPTVHGPYSSLQVGTTEQLTCTATLMDGTTADVTATAAWMSDTPSVQTVSSTGLVTAHALGAGTVYCGLPPVSNMVAVWDPVQPPPYYSGAYISVVSGASSTAVTGSTIQNQKADWETVGNLSVKPSGSPTDVRFLSTLAWTNSSGTPASATLVQSTAGDAFDCGHISNSLACFKHNLGSVTGTTIPLNGATAVYIDNLAANTSYPIAATGAPTSGVSDNAGVLTFAAAGSGSAVIGTGTAASSHVHLSWTASTTAGVDYQVYRTAATGTCPTSITSYGTAIATAITTTSYDDTSTLDTGGHCYVVLSELDGVLSDPSNAASVTIAVVKPAPPSGLTVTPPARQKH
jgi:hypothetical protein